MSIPTPPHYELQLVNIFYFVEIQSAFFYLQNGLECFTLILKIWTKFQ